MDQTVQLAEAAFSYSWPQSGSQYVATEKGTVNARPYLPNVQVQNPGGVQDGAFRTDIPVKPEASSRANIYLGGCLTACVAVTAVIAQPIRDALIAQPLAVVTIFIGVLLWSVTVVYVLAQVVPRVLEKRRLEENIQNTYEKKYADLLAYTNSLETQNCQLQKENCQLQEDNYQLRMTKSENNESMNSTAQNIESMNSTAIGVKAFAELCKKLQDVAMDAIFLGMSLNLNKNHNDPLLKSQFLAYMGAIEAAKNETGQVIRIIHSECAMRGEIHQPLMLDAQS